MNCPPLARYSDKAKALRERAHRLAATTPASGPPPEILEVRGRGGPISGGYPPVWTLGAPLAGPSVKTVRPVQRPP
eukprot:10796169-Lingulodinium_polyedra.AAC.1